MMQREFDNNINRRTYDAVVLNFARDGIPVLTLERCLVALGCLEHKAKGIIWYWHAVGMTISLKTAKGTCYRLKTPIPPEQEIQVPPGMEHLLHTSTNPIAQ